MQDLNSTLLNLVASLTHLSKIPNLTWDESKFGTHP